MHRCTWALLLVTACVYRPPGTGEGKDQGDDDPRPDSHGDDEIACNAEDPLLCMEFELGLDDFQAMATAFDGSGNEHHADSQGVVATHRYVLPAVPDDNAALFGSFAKLEIPHEIGIAGSVTVEAWVQRLGAVGTLFDSSGRFFMGSNSEQEIVCGINALRVDGRASLKLEWQHVACVFDATKSELRIYVDGAVDQCATFAGQQIDTTPHEGATTTIGADFSGSLDGLHVYSRALAPSDICNHAGRGTNCVSQCPSGGGGGPGPPGS